MDKEKIDESFTDEEYEQFVNDVVRDSWETSRDGDALHDISITHVEKDREILVNSAKNRLSYRKTNPVDWGIRQKPVGDLREAVTKLQTVGLFIPMDEMRYLGFDGHPVQPDDLY